MLTKNVDLNPSILQPTTSSAPAREAAFDEEMKVPKCGEEASSCTAPVILLEGTAANREPNQMGSRQSNTIDDCKDGTAGSYAEDESIESLAIVSVDSDGEPWDLPLKIGGKAKISARVHAWTGSGTDPSNDYADFWYKPDLGQDWKFLETIRLTETDVDGDGFGTLTSEAFDIEGPQLNQAIRVNFRYQGQASQCSAGSWADTDDMTFVVAPSVPPTAPPTSPVSMIHVAVAHHCICLSHIVHPYYLSCALAYFEPNEPPYEQSYQCSVEQRKSAVW